MSLSAPGEMTTHEAVAYLNEWLAFPITADIVYRARSVLGQPVAEKRGRRLVFRRPDLDAFLAEFGTDPLQWHSGWSRDAIADLRARGVNDPQVESILRGIDPAPDDWHPDDARP